MVGHVHSTIDLHLIVIIGIFLFIIKVVICGVNVRTRK